MPDNDAVLVVVDTLREHGFGHTEESMVSSRTVDHCRCGWRSTFEHRTHADHVAAAVVDALELERQYAASDAKFPGMVVERTVSTDPKHADKWLAVDEPGWIKVSRWVSGWVREPAEEGKP